MNKTIFTQYIGIFYNDFKWADEIFDEEVSKIPLKLILRINKTEKNNICELKDGSWIQTIDINSYSLRGWSVNKAIIQDGIDEEIIYPLLKNCICVIGEEKDD